MPSCRMRLGAARVMSSPRNVMRPAAGASTPEIARKVVVLPAPLAPINVTSSPWFTSIDNSRTAATLPYLQVRPSTLSTCVPLAEIGANHIGVLLDFRRRAAGDDAAVVQTDDP